MNTPGMGSVGVRARQIARDMATHGRPVDLSQAPPPGGLQLNIAVQVMADAIVRHLRQTQIHASPPAYHEPPFTSNGFDEIGLQSLGPGADWTTLASFSVPQNHFAVLKGWGQDVDDLAAFDDLEWRITIDGIPQQPYTVVTRQIGTIAALREAQIVISPGAVVAIQARNTSGGDTWEATGCIKGWYWSPTLTGAEGSFEGTLAD